jgi:2-polyprenyl-3-methyl-5-hydroxy-6-metoxy-1,4-benzoquinol methylase
MNSSEWATGYLGKEQHYFGYVRFDLIEWVPADPPGRVLEIGAADGATLVALKRSGKAREVVGVELVPLPSGRQESGEIDQFLIADIETRTLDLALESFDVILCGDVLEHLRDPWGTLAYLTGFLKPGGRFLISLPNIRYWRAFGRIILGDFRYAPSGVLDRTHLRFFCRKNMLDLVRSASLEVRHVEPSFKRQRELRIDKLMNSLTLGLVEAFLAQQYLIVAEKPAGTAQNASRTPAP